MQEATDLIPETPPQEPTCATCGSPEILDGYPARLCAPCRQAYIKFPIPNWVKLFGGAILLLVVVSFTLSWKNFNAGIAISRAEKFEEQHDHMSAQKELKKALDISPNSVTALGHLAIASFHNGDLGTFGITLSKLTGKDIEDKEMLTTLNGLNDKSVNYYPSEAFQKLGERYPNTIPDSALLNYINTHPGDVFARFTFASMLMDRDDDLGADRQLGAVLAAEPGHMFALYLRTITKRELNQLDSSIYYADQALHDNRQFTVALSSKARTLLKQRHYKDGLAMAQHVDDLDSELHYNKATLALAYHLNNNFKERDVLLKSAQKDSTLGMAMSYVNDVISGKKNF